MATANNNWLKEFRKYNRLTQVQAAQLLEVSVIYISMIERGVRPLTDRMISRMKSVQKSKERRS